MQTCNIHRFSIAESFAPNKFLTPGLRNSTAVNFTFLRHNSNVNNEPLNQSSSTVDLTEDVIPEAPEVPIELADINQAVEKVLVFTYILFNSIKKITRF